MTFPCKSLQILFHPSSLSKVWYKVIDVICCPNGDWLCLFFSHSSHLSLRTGLGDFLSIFVPEHFAHDSKLWPYLFGCLTITASLQSLQTILRNRELGWESWWPFRRTKPTGFVRTYFLMTLKSRFFLDSKVKRKFPKKNLLFVFFFLSFQIQSFCKRFPKIVLFLGVNFSDSDVKGVTSILDNGETLCWNRATIVRASQGVLSQEGPGLKACWGIQSHIGVPILGHQLLPEFPSSIRLKKQETKRSQFELLLEKDPLQCVQQNTMAWSKKTNRRHLWQEGARERHTVKFGSSVKATLSLQQVSWWIHQLTRPSTPGCEKIIFQVCL